MRQFELVIPAYNESKSLSELVSRMAAGAIEANLDENKFLPLRKLFRII